MVFLKRIESQGFKSFGEKVDIKFEYGMTGVVGPNGSGKSNIHESIRWCLGEKSMKSLRGKGTEDIIFAGSKNKDQLNTAWVRLTFHNIDNRFDYDTRDIKIMRKVKRNSPGNEYFINDNPVRLKDIQNFAFEVGINRTSLAIISQNRVSAFAEMSPFERRTVFEDAAGVSKYKKAKEEAIKKLNRNQITLDRIKDLLEEIKKRLPRLKRQAKKAKIYKKQKDKLNEIEVSILVKDINKYNVDIDEIKNKFKDLINYKKELNLSIFANEEEFKNKSNQNYELDNKINNLNKKFETIISEIGNLKIEQIKNNSQNISTQSNIENNPENLAKLYNELKHSIMLEEKKLNELLENQTNLQIKLEGADQKRISLTNNKSNIQKELFKSEHQLELVLKSNKTQSYIPDGPRNIINNRKVLPGVKGMVLELIKPKEEYNIPINACLSSKQYNIIINSSVNAKTCLNFLKNNKAGIATFLPLDKIKPKKINEDIKFALSKMPGYLGMANEFIDFEEEYQKVADYLLGQFILVENYDVAVSISDSINQRYNIISKDGDIIRPYGAVFGGRKRSSSNSSGVSLGDPKILEKQISNLNEQLRNVTTELTTINDEYNLINKQILENQTFLGSTQQKNQDNKNKLLDIEQQYKTSTGENIDKNKIESKAELDVQTQISKKEKEKRDIEINIKTSRDLKESNSKKVQELDAILKKQREELLNFTTNQGKHESKISVLEERIEGLEKILAEDYNMTYDHAKTLKLKEIEDEEASREMVKEIRQELQKIGSVDFSVIEEYETENARFEELDTDYKNLIESKKNLNSAIKNMDKTMEKLFSNLIIEINKKLPKTLYNLFGGGTAELKLTDPKNLLETGVEIKVNPPGKKISNINLLSGGEKSLVALSCLFAILKVKPLPLIMLDEVEAPLDPSNVERFAKYIRKFSNTCQFIIVTHRMGTMSNCDVLFGATMQSKGITKLVNIKLIEAAKLIENEDDKKEK